MSDPLDGSAAAPDVISGGGEDFSAFAVSRWPGLVRQAFGLTGDRRAAEEIAQVALARVYVAWWRVSRAGDPDAYLRRILVKTSNRRFRRHRVTERPGEITSVAPVDAIIRRGRGIRLRRAGVAAGALGLAAIIAALVLAPPAKPPAPVPPAPLPASETPGPGGTFAQGVADGHAWRLAVQDIADPGYACIPAITVDGTDADPVTSSAGNYADTAPGPIAPGLGFAFLQLPAGVRQVVLDGQEHLPATTATACGQRYRLVGFAFRLTHRPTISVVAQPGQPKPRATAGGAAPAWPPVYQLPPASQAATYTISQGDGIWTNVGPVGAETAQGVVASGRAWSITVLLDAGGDCYDFVAPVSFGSPQMGSCSPISTPDGAETIIALPLSFPPDADNAATGYAVQVSPVTAHLRATASDGSTELVTPQVVGGRKYAAFAIGPSLRLTRLTWLDAAGREIASTTALPRYGYTQFQP